MREYESCTGDNLEEVKSYCHNVIYTYLHPNIWKYSVSCINMDINTDKWIDIYKEFFSQFIKREYRIHVRLN